MKPETAEGVGIPPPVTKWPAEGIFVELGVRCIYLCERQGLRWPELAGIKLTAAGVLVTGGATATTCKRSAKEGGSGQWLTASRTSRSVRPEERRSEQGGEADLR